jgi:hypothetical protein
MLLSTTTVVCTTLLTLTTAQPNSFHPHLSEVLERCGTIPGKYVQVTSGKRLEIFKCDLSSICTPADTQCTANCTSYCVPLASCNAKLHCSTGYTCNSRYARPRKAFEDGPEDEDGVCERAPEPDSNEIVPEGRRCGMTFPDCPHPLQHCVGTDPACFSSDVCPAVCRIKPVPPPPKYPSCGGFRLAPAATLCAAPNVCIDDPYSGHSCGMACDAPGICVK